MSRITLMSWNVNGIRAVHRKGFLDWFTEARPDVLCLQETKAQINQLGPELTDVAGYNAYFAQAERKGYSGVALYTREKPVSISYGFGVERFDSEGRTIIADFGWYVFMGIYFPNGKQSPERLRYKMDFYDCFLDYADRLKNEGRNLVICGDVNTAHREIDLARPKENETASGFLPEERAWIDKFLSHGYFDTFRLFNNESGQYTWWNLVTRARERNVGWRIDYFYISESLKKSTTNAWILPDVVGSDHCPIALELERPA